MLINHCNLLHSFDTRSHGNGRCYGKTFIEIDPTMTTDEDKTKIAKLLQGLEVPEVKLTERCHDLVKIFHEKFSKEVEEEEMRQQVNETVYENPYKVDRDLLEDNERKLRELLAESKRLEKSF